MYRLCSIESATRQVLLCDKKTVIHVQSFIISRIHQRYILSYRKLKQCLPSGEPPGWPMSTTRASPPRWRDRPSRLALSRWGNLHDFIIMFTSVRLVWSSPKLLPVELSVHYIDLFQNLRRRPRSARSPLSSSKSGIVASLWEQNSELEAQKLLVLDVVLDKDHVSMCKNISLHWQTWSNQVQ